MERDFHRSVLPLKVFYRTGRVGLDIRQALINSVYDTYPLPLFYYHLQLSRDDEEILKFLVNYSGYVCISCRSVVSYFEYSVKWILGPHHLKPLFETKGCGPFIAWFNVKKHPPKCKPLFIFELKIIPQIL